MFIPVAWFNLLAKDLRANKGQRENCAFDYRSNLQIFYKQNCKFLFDLYGAAIMVDTKCSLTS